MTESRSLQDISGDGVLSAPAPEVAFIRSDGAAATLSAAKQPVETRLPKKLRRFYKSQNAMIDIMLSDLEALSSTDAQSVADKTSPAYPLVRAAVHGSFLLNIGLTAAKLIATVASGSMSALASFADSLLDLVSGVVLSPAGWGTRPSGSAWGVRDGI